MGRKSVGWAGSLFTSLTFASLPFVTGGCSGSSNTAASGESEDAGVHNARGGSAGLDAAGSAGMSSGAVTGGFAGRNSSGAGGTAATGGESGGSSHAGQAGNSANLGGASGGGAAGAGGSGGAQACVAGAACKCADLTGVVECRASGPACVCPAAQQCTLEDGAKCFEPCGGEPFGGWVLEGSCFAAGSFSTGVCHTATQATAGLSDLRLRILDGGELDLFVHEDWSTKTQISLACSSLYSTVACPSAFYSSDALLFGSMPAASCTASACGACDCTSAVPPPVPDDFIGSIWSPSSWSVAGDTTLNLANRNVPYCVQGDELWIGGQSDNGPPQVAYKFKKQSCTGAPVSCANRTSAECQAGSDCTLGKCEATVPANAAHCTPAADASDCQVLQGCTWAPNTCYGDANPQCDFISCGKVPGCTWGPPLEKCGGFPSCDGLGAADCAVFGCDFTSCGASDLNDVDCAQLTSTADCTRARGCVSHPGTAAPCTGTTQCSAQHDLTTCAKLGCVDVGVASCGGEPVACEQLSTTDCHRLPGCRIEW